SRHSKSDICKHLQIPQEKVTVAGCAANLVEPFADQQSPYETPYILAVGALEPRKNIANLIAAFLKLPDKNLRLVIVGKSDLQVFRQTQERLCNAGATEDKRVIFTGYVDDHKLTTLYHHAIGFCYPSFYEGFGLPPLEAQAQGCPVIVSKRASLPEVFGDSALYCNPENIDNIAHMLQFLIDDQDLREQLKLAGFKNCRRFNWRQSAEKIVTAIETCIVR
ncbi:glycosyltransferase family 4 protein, partial [bacterium]|nr:glycosyltransferase family 4 protein [bacterium]